jgi:hypothetical protein
LSSLGFVEFSGRRSLVRKNQDYDLGSILCPIMEFHYVLYLNHLKCISTQGCETLLLSDSLPFYSIVEVSTVMKK